MSRPDRLAAHPSPKSARAVTAVLGPTNTGKTHLAIARLLAHDSGIIGLPLRLLAREVYDEVTARVGASQVALITGEEKIKPPRPRYFVCTVEAMPLEEEVEFLAVDEIQLAADSERGHVFTDRMFHARGNAETLLLGAATMRQAITDLLPGVNTVSRPRLSKLTYAGHKKLSRLPRRSAIIAFSASDVYAIAELIRRQRGGAAVVLGALSPRTRNAQVELYQSGEVDCLVATDAIGMGLNLDVNHVAFSAVRKFDGHQHRALTPAEIAQIAGRAGRYSNDGTFGVTASAEPFAPDLVAALENHAFDDERVLQWRSRKLDFSSLDRLKESLQLTPKGKRLARNRMVADQIALENLSLDDEIRGLAIAPAAIKLLWNVCQIPDYQKISSVSHAELAATLYRFLMSDGGHIPEDWFAQQVDLAHHTEGDIDTLANRVAHIRTWTYVSHRSDWLADATHWQEKTHEIEEALSDALHERLTQRFVDRRTSVLMRRLRDKEDLHAEIGDDGAIYVERYFIGRLQGFRFFPASLGEGINGKMARNAASKVLGMELSRRADELAHSDDGAIAMSGSGDVMWQGQAIARLEAGDAPLRPAIRLRAGDAMADIDHEKVIQRLERWRDGLITIRLGPLGELADADDISGLARGVAFQLVESFGVLNREDVSDDIRSLDQDARGQLRKYGVRFGAFNIYFPQLLKPAAADLLQLLWALRHGEAAGLTLSALPEPPRQGLTSAPADPAVGEAYYRVMGFHTCGKRIVRIDMLERLADMIRPLVAARASESAPEPPPGATGDGGFTILPDMMSIVGCSGEEFAQILRALNFQCSHRATTSHRGVKTTRATETPTTPLAESDVPADDDDGQPDDEIWRPRRRRNTGLARVGQRKSDKPRIDAKPGGGAKRETSANRRRSKNRRLQAKPSPAKSASRPKNKQVRADPNSPFAVLGQLKEDLKRDSKRDVSEKV